jgi:hypothetical protein
VLAAEQSTEVAEDDDDRGTVGPQLAEAPGAAVGIGQHHAGHAVEIHGRTLTAALGRPPARGRGRVPARDARSDGGHDPPLLPVTHPSERVGWLIETARAVLDGRVTSGDGARAASMQVEQLADLLRVDRSSVTQRECDDVATRLRRYAEQLTDSADGADDAANRLELARALGTLGQALR